MVEKIQIFILNYCCLNFRLRSDPKKISKDKMSKSQKAQGEELVASVSDESVRANGFKPFIQLVHSKV